MGEKWDDSLQSKEQVEANLLSKYESAMRREKALAYSFSHQVAIPLNALFFSWHTMFGLFAMLDIISFVCNDTKYVLFFLKSCATQGLPGRSNCAVILSD